MKKIIEVKNLIFDYFRRDKDGNIEEEIEALSGIDIKVKQGEFVSIIGANGSGKSTLAKNLNALLIPTEGTVLIQGMNIEDESKRFDIRSTVGMIFQNPDNQIVGATVETDVAFGPENLGIESNEIQRRVNEMLDIVGLSDAKKASVSILSGGQKQKLAVAGVLAMKPQCIILDEATSMLDPEARMHLMELVHRMNQEMHLTVIHISHDMNEVMESDYVYLMKDGRIRYEGRPVEVFSRSEMVKECGLDIPLVIRLLNGFNIVSRLQQYHLNKMSLFDFERLVADLIIAKGLQPRICELHDRRLHTAVEKSLVCNHVSYQYPITGQNETPFMLKDISFAIGRGEFVGIVGCSGSGKTTLLQMFNGILKPTEGNVYFDGEDIWDENYSKRTLRQRIGLVFQFPEHQLFEETVYKDVVFGPYQMDISKVEAEKLAFEAIKDIGLPENIYDASPFHLSGGQKRKVALAGVLAMKPEYLVLDEPTVGLDPDSKRELLEYFRYLCDEKNITVIMVSHSMEDIAEYTDRMLVMKDGRLIKDDTTRSCFMDEAAVQTAGIHPPTAMRVAQCLRQAGVPVQQEIIREQELLRALGVK